MKKTVLFLAATLFCLSLSVPAYAEPNSYAAQQSFPFVEWIAGSLVAGIAVALIVTGIMRRKLKSVRPQRNAANYVRKGSMVLTEHRDTFLYRTVTKTPRPNTDDRRGKR